MVRCCPPSAIKVRFMFVINESVLRVCCAVFKTARSCAPATISKCAVHGVYAGSSWRLALAQKTQSRALGKAKYIHNCFWIVFFLLWLLLIGWSIVAAMQPTWIGVTAVVCRCIMHIRKAGSMWINTISAANNDDVKLQILDAIILCGRKYGRRLAKNWFCRWCNRIARVLVEYNFWRLIDMCGRVVMCSIISSNLCNL